MPTLKNNQIGSALEGVRALQKERVAVLTGIKLRKISRALVEAALDVDAERQELLKRHANLDAAGQVVSDKDGQAVFPTPEARASFLAEQKELYEGDLEIADSLTLADLRRRERDEAGKVYETDELPGYVIEQLGELLVIEEPTRPAKIAAA